MSKNTFNTEWNKTLWKNVSMEAVPTESHVTSLVIESDGFFLDEAYCFTFSIVWVMF